MTGAVGERERHLVELVTPEGVPAGSSTVELAHAVPGQLHRAFSVLLFAPDGRTLLQRRAATKTRFPLGWANACCGHPGPGESPVRAAARRLVEELGLTDVPLTEVGVHTYAATDPATGRVEREYDHVLVGELDPAGPLLLDPAEVASTRWVTTSVLLDDIATTPGYVPWLAGVLRVALGAQGLSSLR
jgi:isopentenyl-diphosphate Delta-isomerase